MKKQLSLFAVLSLLIIGCLPFPYFQNELERINKEARQLHEDAHSFIHKALKDAAEIGRQTVASVNIKAGAIDKRAIRFAAVTTATTLADDALKTMVMHQARAFDKIFGVNRSEIVASMILEKYGYPIVNDIIIAYTDFYVYGEKEGNKEPPSIDSIVEARLTGFSIEDAVKMVQGFGNSKHTPEYYRQIALATVNSDRYCATRNWKDNGLIYQYRISDSGIDMRYSDAPWESLRLPFTDRPVSIAADNNRLLVLTDNHELWWYCIKNDQAQWSIDLMNTAVEFMAIKPLVEGGVCEVLLPLMAQTADSIARASSTIKYLDPWKKLDKEGQGSLDYWKIKCSFWTDAVLSIDRMLLKTDSSGSFTAKDYALWSETAHQTGTWSNALTWNSDTIVYKRGRNISPEKITDIAIGNWNGTVVTVYVVADGKIWFLDEEIIQPEWKPIEKWNDSWALLGKKDYHEHENKPYPLDSLSKIDASNSVIAVLKKTGESSAVHWLRWDYHQKDDFVYWPLDWCEHGWKSAICPAGTRDAFRISSLEGIDPREEHTVWSIPAPAFTFHNYLPQDGYKGIFGDVPREMVSTYPVNIWINTNDTILMYSVKKSEAADKNNVEWKNETD